MTIVKSNKISIELTPTYVAFYSENTGKTFTSRVSSGMIDAYNNALNFIWDNHMTLPRQTRRDITIALLESLDQLDGVTVTMDGNGDITHVGNQTIPHPNGGINVNSVIRTSAIGDLLGTTISTSSELSGKPISTQTLLFDATGLVDTISTVRCYINTESYAKAIKYSLPDVTPEFLNEVANGVIIGLGESLTEAAKVIK